jgi:hypothetical protein
MLLISLIAVGSLGVSALAWALLRASDEKGGNKYNSPVLRSLLGFLRILTLVVGLFFLTGLFLMMRPDRGPEHQPSKNPRLHLLELPKP